MIQKKILVRNKVRKVPKHFSFVDHRLVRDGHIDHLSHKAAALYLFLVTVGDAHGLSYYGDKSVCKRLHFSENDLQEARRNLIQTDLIAYEEPLYQVLGLELEKAPCQKPVFRESRSTQGLTSVKDILREIVEDRS
jgi:hypothetical protein